MTNCNNDSIYKILISSVSLDTKQVDPSYMETKFAASTSFKLSYLEKKLRNTSKIADTAMIDKDFPFSRMPSSIHTIPGEMPLFIKPKIGWPLLVDI